MFDRKLHTWNVSLAPEEGPPVTHEVQCYWDPKTQGTADAVAHATAATIRAKGVPVQAITATLEES